MIINKNCIVLEKITHQNIDLDEFLQRLDELETDPNQPTLEEINEIVKDVRLELWSNPLELSLMSMFGFQPYCGEVFLVKFCV